MVLIFPRPSRKPVSWHDLINILFRMGKRMPKTGSKQADLVVGSSLIRRSTASQQSAEPLPPCPHFLQPPNTLHQITTNSNLLTPTQNAFLAPSNTHFLLFFNYQKYYSKIELDCYVICLANHINSLPSDFLTPNTECKNKFKRFLQDLTQQDSRSQQYENKARALFYILVAIIYKQKSRQTGKSLLADRNIVRAILKLSIPNNSKISKFYGIIMLAITNKTHTKSMREAIVRSILVNLERIQHPPTLFNLLVHLRGEKGKIRISINDLREGKVMPFLAEGYRQFAGDYQSYYLLDYLLHLMQLFPSLAGEAVTPDFVKLLLIHLRARSMHHPLHEQAILTFISQGLKFLEVGKEEVLAQVKVQVGDIYTESKIGKISVEHQQCQQLVERVASEDYLMNFIDAVKPTQESNVLINCIELILMAANKIQTVNLNLAKYLLWLIKSRTLGLSLTDPTLSVMLAPAWDIME